MKIIIKIVAIKNISFKLIIVFHINFQNPILENFCLILTLKFFCLVIYLFIIWVQLFETYLVFVKVRIFNVIFKHFFCWWQNFINTQVFIFKLWICFYFAGCVRSSPRRIHAIRFERNWKWTICSLPHKNL